MRHVLKIAAIAVVILSVVPAHAQKIRSVRRSAPSPDCNPDKLAAPMADECRAARLREGRRLFDSETFGGNGRTCATCHSPETGTFSAAEAKDRLAANPRDPLFVHDALDDGLTGTSRIEKNGTIRVTLPIPAHLTLVGQPGVTHVTLFRATPTTKNTPALDTRLMSDLRDQTLVAQALGAIRGHAQSTVEPTALQLELIAEFQRTDPRFFSSDQLRQFAQGGPQPQLPEGTTDSEKRGRKFFLDQPLAPPSAAGVCALCHSGPMLNESNVFSTPSSAFGSPAGVRIFSAGVSERNVLNNPVYTFVIKGGARVTTPDIGVLMSDPTSGFLSFDIPPAGGPPLAFFANFFKTTTLWGVKDTAPYFHDNSAADMQEMLEHYNWFFENGPLRGRIKLTPEDMEDIKAFMKLL